MSGHLDGTKGRPPTIMAMQGMVASGHYLSSAAGNQILQSGGNAVDAGIAAGLVLNVVHGDMNSFGGVAPVILYDKSRDEVVSYRGIGWWSKDASVAHFQEKYGGDIPKGNLAACVVPGAPDAWLSALKNHGTMTFEQVSKNAIYYAKHGFPVTDFMIQTILGRKADFEAPSTAEIYLTRDGEPPLAGELLVQTDLANLFESMIEVERDNASEGREAALQALRDYFYRGPITNQMVDHVQRHEGLLTVEDFNEYEAKQYPSIPMDFGRFTVHGCGPWCQGPMVPLALNILKNFDLEVMGHNSPEYIHTVVSALNLAFSDRHHYMGDPARVAVPIEGMMTAEYGEERAKLIETSKAFRELPPPGDPWGYQSADIAWPGDPVGDRVVYRDVRVPEGELQASHLGDTSYVSAADRFGNFFSATPSDGVRSIVPGLGIAVSERGVQSWTEENNPNAIGPRKTPRLTPNPGLIFRDGKPWAAYGTPGNDRQPQAMLQVFLNMAVFGMEPQDAIDAPRFASYNMPASSHPHQYIPGEIRIEKRIPESVRDTLASWGHQVHVWPPFMPAAGAPCISIHDPETGIFHGAADSRRQSQAIGF